MSTDVVEALHADVLERTTRFRESVKPHTKNEALKILKANKGNLSKANQILKERSRLVKQAHRTHPISLSSVIEGVLRAHYEREGRIGDSTVKKGGFRAKRMA